jgi:hypothetical protein
MKIEIFEEDGDNTLSFDDKYAEYTIDIYPDSKTYESRMNLKDDVYYRTEKFEYRIKTDPLKVETRLTERIDEPPERCCVKDGVVLESDILTDRKESTFSSMTREFVDGLKKEVEWHEEWSCNPVTMYILSKHSEIITPDGYRRNLRQLSEKIKSATLKVEMALKSDKMGFQVLEAESDSARTIWLPKSKQQGLSEEDLDKFFEHQNKLHEQFFDEKSSEYVGVSDAEFRSSFDILENIDIFLNKEINSVNMNIEPKLSKTKGYIISFLLTLVLSWVVSWFIDINPFLIFIIVQAIAFAQSIIGGWLGKLLNE